MLIEAPRILDFDIENRPLNFLGGDLVGTEITAIACSFNDDDFVYCWLRGELPMGQILFRFSQLYQQADIVTGHYIRVHDLPIINGALVEAGMPTLGPKLTIDTKLDLKPWSFQAQGKSQEALATTLGIESPKVGMSQAMWREANRLTTKGLTYTRERVVGDVKQHKELRLELTRRGLLTAPKTWSPKV